MRPGRRRLGWRSSETWFRKRIWCDARVGLGGMRPASQNCCAATCRERGLFPGFSSGVAWMQGIEQWVWVRQVQALSALLSLF